MGKQCGQRLRRFAAHGTGATWLLVASALDLDGSCTVPNDGAPQPAADHFPPPLGVRFTVFTVPPAGAEPVADLDPRAARQELDEKFPGRSKHMERDQAGLHTTASIDFIYVVSGEIGLELDDGREIRLRAGDTVVQNGVRHAWRNHSDQPCTMVICLLGAERRAACEDEHPPARRVTRSPRSVQ
jgi:quercetin dioxygenase-like cupin family protein